MRCKFLFLLILSLYPWLPNVAQIESPDQNDVLARIGPRTITERDLLERIELMPWPGKDQPAMHDSAVTNAILSLVAEKLISLEASGVGVGQDKDSRATFAVLERVFARDELFRQEIVARVSISSEEIEQALRRYASELKLAVFAVRSEQDARSLVSEFNGRSNGTLPSPLRARTRSRDTIIVTCGTLVQAHEDIAYGIASMFGARASYTASSGWLVFRLLDRRPNPAAMKLNLADRQATVENLLRKRRQAELTVHYFNRFIGDGEIRMDSVLFSAMADTLLTLMRRNQDAHRKGTAFGVVETDIEELVRVFAREEDRPFVSLRNDTVRFGTILRGMNLHPIQVRSLRTRHFKEDLNRAMMMVAEAELMSEWAVRHHYNAHPDVRRDLSAWMEAAQTQEMVKRLLDSLSTQTGQRGAKPDAGDPLDDYIAALANKYGVEIDFQKVGHLKVVPFNMVTRRYIGFGGTLPAVPLLPHLWDWYESWKKEKSATP